MMEFIIGFVAGMLIMLIVDFFVDRRIGAQRKLDQHLRDEALKKKRKPFHPQEMITR